MVTSQFNTFERDHARDDGGKSLGTADGSRSETSAAEADAFGLDGVGEQEKTESDRERCDGTDGRRDVGETGHGPAVRRILPGVFDPDAGQMEERTAHDEGEQHHDGRGRHTFFRGNEGHPLPVREHVHQQDCHHPRVGGGANRVGHEKLADPHQNAQLDDARDGEGDDACRKIATLAARDRFEPTFRLGIGEEHAGQKGEDGHKHDVNREVRHRNKRGGMRRGLETDFQLQRRPVLSRFFGGAAKAFAHLVDGERFCGFQTTKRLHHFHFGGKRQRRDGEVFSNQGGGRTVAAVVEHARIRLSDGTAGAADAKILGNDEQAVDLTERQSAIVIAVGFVRFPRHGTAPQKFDQTMGGGVVGKVDIGAAHGRQIVAHDREAGQQREDDGHDNAENNDRGAPQQRSEL